MIDNPYFVPNVDVTNALSRDMKAQLEKRGYWVYRPFWRRLRDRWGDRWEFFRHECGYPFWYSLLMTI